MDPREQRGHLIAARCRLAKTNDGAWLVPSQSGKGSYRVYLDHSPTPSTPMCSCPDFEATGQPCKHVYAARIVSRREQGNPLPLLSEVVELTEKSTVASKPTYPQNWTAYNAAQKNEKRLFRRLLYELCQGIEEPVYDRRPQGRPRNSRRDTIFSLVYKVFVGSSGRRFQSDLNDMYEKGYLTKELHYNSLINYMADLKTSDTLQRLIRESSLPLAEVEEVFAVDSTGFTCSRFDRWHDHKYGKFMKRHSWVKAHIITGVATHIVPWVMILDKDANDSPQLPELVAMASIGGFQLKEVTADKEYLSVDNVLAIRIVGATPYIAIKKSTTGAVGGLFEKMYLAYRYNKEEYMSHYHQRSNAESTFSMMKRKFGDSVRSKIEVAMKNEALCKILCHNICCLIQSFYELGIKPEFWAWRQDGKKLPVEPMEDVRSNTTVALNDDWFDDSEESDRRVPSDLFEESLMWI